MMDALPFVTHSERGQFWGQIWWPQGLKAAKFGSCKHPGQLKMTESAGTPLPCQDTPKFQETDPTQHV